MKEILYIQAGSLSNFIGTHFWNTQAYYLDSENNQTESRISFREAQDDNGSLMCPRLLVFDKKSNFGSLVKDAVIEADTSEDTDAGLSSLWNGQVVEYRQPEAHRSKYQERLSSSTESDLDTALDGESELDITRWADFNRVYYSSRSPQMIPEGVAWEGLESDWTTGKELFEHLNEESSVIEGAVRFFLEECDSVQGINIINDSYSFGSFTKSLLSSLRDDGLKIPSIAFPILSPLRPSNVAFEDAEDITPVINDAMYLRDLSELCTTTIPIQHPNLWDGLPKNVYMNVHKPFYTSALISAFLETSTLPLRLKGSQDDISAFTAQLNWQHASPFAELSGTVNAGIDQTLFNLTRGCSFDSVHGILGRRDVSRGFTQSDIVAYDSWRGQILLPDSYYPVTHGQSYPLPSSFPSIFSPGNSRFESVNLMSSLTTSTGLSTLFVDYATAVDRYVRLGRRSGRGILRDLTPQEERDELKELANDLWTLNDNLDEAGSDNEPVEDGNSDCD